MADFNIGDVIGLNRIVKVVDLDKVFYYVLQAEGATATPFMEKVEVFDSKFSKKVALTKIEEQVNIIKEALRTAQGLADVHSLKFSISLDLPESNDKDSDYAHRVVSGKYIGKGSESSKSGDIWPNEGHWYWENSSLNC